MGLSIHYSGTIDRAEDIPQFVEELTDIAESMDWMVQLINDDEADPLLEGASVDDIVARIEQIAKKLHEDRDAPHCRRPS